MIYQLRVLVAKLGAPLPLPPPPTPTHPIVFQRVVRHSGGVLVLQLHLIYRHSEPSVVEHASIAIFEVALLSCVRTVPIQSLPSSPHHRDVGSSIPEVLSTISHFDM